ncbi:MAG: ribbon-helix-helix protein, CopG family [Candidatus Eremiobacterota bacterium]
MSRETHLSVRVSREEKEALERLAAQADISVGRLVRRALTTFGSRNDRL